MDGEVDGTQTTDQGQQADQAQQQEAQVDEPTDEEIRAALAERDEKIADLEDEE